MRPLSVLVYEHLSAGAEGDQAELLSVGRDMRTAMVSSLAALPGVTVSHVTAPWEDGGVRARPGESAPALLSRLAVGHDLIWAVAPEAEGLLAACCASVPAGRWMGCDPDAIRVATSKSLTLAALEAVGVLTPLDPAVRQAARAWVVKPDDGAGALATQRFQREEEARMAWADRDARGLTSTLEPWVDGLPMSLSLAVGASGTTLVSVNQLHMHVAPDGHVSMAGLTRNVMGEGDPARARLARLARQVVAAIPGLKGFVGIDYVDHPVFGPVVIEVNPRVTWAFAGLSEATGLSLGAMLLDVFASEGRPVPEKAHA